MTDHNQLNPLLLQLTTSITTSTSKNKGVNHIQLLELQKATTNYC